MMGIKCHYVNVDYHDGNYNHVPCMRTVNSIAQGVTCLSGRLPPFFKMIQSELGWSGLYRMIISVFDAPSCRSQVVWQSMQNRASTF